MGVSVNQVGSILSPFFVPNGVDSYKTATGSDLQKYAKYFAEMLSRGVALAPAQFEAMFVSAAHAQADLDATAQAVDASFAAL